MIMSEPGTYRAYRPSNGTEGDIFMDEWCFECARNGTDDNPCKIQCRALAHSIDEPEYPAEWRYGNNGEPMCTAFTTDMEDAAAERCTKTLDLFGEQSE